MHRESAERPGWTSFLLRTGDLDVDVLVRRDGIRWLALVVRDDEPSLGVALSEPGAI